MNTVFLDFPALRVATVAITVLTVAGCSGSRPAGQDAARTSAEGTTEQTTERTSPKSPERSSAEIEALYWARQDSARSRYSEADVEFMTGMIGHHAQALVMAALAPKNGAGSTVRTLAARIINAQNDEIASMQKWLRDRGQSVPEVHIAGTALMVHGGGDHAMHMPGMLTPEQIRELEMARGKSFDKLFLTYMIQHHSGAVTMVDKLFATDGSGQDEAAFKLATDIHVDQITEIARMEKMLAILAGTSRDP